MTIAIGVLCRDGVVVGADREVSLNTHKVLGPKAFLLKRDNVSIGLVGAGTYDLIPHVSQELDRRIWHNMTLVEVHSVVDKMVQDIHVKHIQADPDAKHKLDLLIGVKTTPRDGERTVGLLKVNGTIVMWKEPYEAVGWGHELAHYVLGGLYGKRDTLSVLRGIFIVAHALKMSKTHTMYSGGPSDIIHIQLGKVADFVHEDDIRLHEESADRFAEIIKPVRLAMTDINVTSDQLDDLIGKMMVELHSFRPSAFREAQAAHLNMSPIQPRTAILHQDLSSVFGVVETSAPPGPWESFDPDEDT